MQSTIRPETSEVLIVAEAMHPSAAADLERLQQELLALLGALGATTHAASSLNPTSPRFEIGQA
jgi:DNA/RNA-binding domain of Phe-tRNA-synthetase-like protein